MYTRINTINNNRFWGRINASDKTLNNIFKVQNPVNLEIYA